MKHGPCDSSVIFLGDHPRKNGRQTFRRPCPSSECVPVRTIEAYYGVDVYLHALLILELDAGKWTASHRGVSRVCPVTKLNQY